MIYFQTCLNTVLFCLNTSHVFTWLIYSALSFDLWSTNLFPCVLIKSSSFIIYSCLLNLIHDPWVSESFEPCQSSAQWISECVSECTGSSFRWRSAVFQWIRKVCKWGAIMILNKDVDEHLSELIFSTCRNVGWVCVLCGSFHHQHKFLVHFDLTNLWYKW